jgi:hypothetical protein
MNSRGIGVGGKRKYRAEAKGNNAQVFDDSFFVKGKVKYYEWHSQSLEYPFY